MPSTDQLTKAERLHHRRLFEKWKQDNLGPLGGMSRYGMTLLKHPTFRAALGRLTNEHGYSLTDVGWFLGVSRERVRQWVNDGGIPARRGAQYRIWDDDLNRFVVCGKKKDYDRAVKKIRRPEPLYQKRRRIARWVLIDLGEDLGRVPGHTDMSDAFMMDGGRVNGWLNFNSRAGAARTITSGLDRLWRSAGYPVRPNYAHGGRGRPDREHKSIPGRPRAN